VLGDRVTENVLGGLGEQVLRAARAQGYAAGWAEGRRRAAEQVEDDRVERLRLAEQDRLDTQVARDKALVALARATDDFHEQLATSDDELTTHAVTLALEIAEAVVGRELAISADPGADAVRRALRKVSPTATVTVHLHPDDRAALDLTVLGDRRVSLVDDPGLARGDAVLKTDTGIVDATIGAALARVREVLAR
jgi:flagellar assembly protein FliH